MFAMEEKTLMIIAAVLGIALIVMSVGAYLFPSVFGAWFTQRQAAEDSVENTYNWENAKENYEWFKQQKQDIKAQRAQIENYKQKKEEMLDMYGEDPSEWERTTRVEYNRVQNQITGARNVHEQMVADYNSRANQAHRAMFQCGLPYEMEEKFWLGDGRPDDKYEPGVEEEAPEDPTECTELQEAVGETP